MTGNYVVKHCRATPGVKYDVLAVYDCDAATAYEAYEEAVRTLRPRVGFEYLVVGRGSK